MKSPNLHKKNKIEDWDFFSDWEKSHLNSIGNGAEFWPLGTQKKNPALFLFANLFAILQEGMYSYCIDLRREIIAISALTG